MTTEYLGTAAVAERAGLAVPTIRSYIRKGLLPDAEVVITTPSGPLRGWAPETIDAWLDSRPGRGARTDLSSPSFLPPEISEFSRHAAAIHVDLVGRAGRPS